MNAGYFYAPYVPLDGETPRGSPSPPTQRLVPMMQVETETISMEGRTRLNGVWHAEVLPFGLTVGDVVRGWWELFLKVAECIVKKVVR